MKLNIEIVLLIAVGLALASYILYCLIRKDSFKVDHSCSNCSLGQVCLFGKCVGDVASGAPTCSHCDPNIACRGKNMCSKNDKYAVGAQIRQGPYCDENRKCPGGGKCLGHVCAYSDWN